MTQPTSESLRRKKCVPCEGGVPVMEGPDAAEHLKAIPEWAFDTSEKMISRKLGCRNFLQAIELIRKIADVAESEQHHPDLHLTGYRKLRIDLTTHAIGGLSENDFIVAAKIDEILAAP